MIFVSVILCCVWTPRVFRAHPLFFCFFDFSHCAQRMKISPNRSFACFLTWGTHVPLLLLRCLCSKPQRDTLHSAFSKTISILEPWENGFAVVPRVTYGWQMAVVLPLFVLDDTRSHHFPPTVWGLTYKGFTVRLFICCTHTWLHCILLLFFFYFFPLFLFSLLTVVIKSDTDQSACFTSACSDLYINHVFNPSHVP